MSPNRYDESRALGYRDRKLGEQTEAEKRHNDDMAEAAEDWLSVFVYGFPIRKPRRADRGYDLRTPDGRTVDVKWSRWIPGAHYGREFVGYPTLNLSTWKGKQRAMIYALVVGEQPPDFDVYAWAHGWASLDECLAAPLVQGPYKRPFHALGFDYLHPLEELR